jgi:hypothetical protein
MIGMTIFNKNDFVSVFHNLGLIVTLIIFIAATHEVLTLFCGLFHQLWMIIYVRCKKV